MIEKAININIKSLIKNPLSIREENKKRHISFKRRRKPRNECSVT